MTYPVFVKMHHPNLPATFLNPVSVAEQAVDDQVSRGWVLVAGSTPLPTSPYLTPLIADSRYLRSDDADDPGTPTGAALRAAVDDQLQRVDPDGSQVVESSKVTGDTQNRYERRADGSVAVGPGGSTPLGTDGMYVIDLGDEKFKHGLVIRGSSDPSPTGQLFVFYDHLGQPIMSLPVAGGLGMYGDHVRVHGGTDIFNPEVALRLDGTIQARKGDTGGGVGVFALGAATTAPTRNPDGTVNAYDADTVAGMVMWTDTDGRTRIRRASGPIDVIGGNYEGFGPPTAGTISGDTYMEASDKRLRFYDGSAWRRIAVADRTKRTIAGAYTLVAGDASDMVLHSTSASALTITLPQDSAVFIQQELPIRWRQYGAGQITFAAGTGATLQALGSAYKSAGQNAEGQITKVNANTWLLSGDIVA